MKLIEYIKESFDGNQSAFAKEQGVRPQQITEWIKKGFIVVDGCLYSKRRELNK